MPVDDWFAGASLDWSACKGKPVFNVRIDAWKGLMWDGVARREAELLRSNGSLRSATRLSSILSRAREDSLAEL